MKLRRLLLPIVVASMLLPRERLEAQIAPISGNNLYSYCGPHTAAKPTDQWLLGGTCMGYVTAIMDALSSGNSVNGFRACIPANADMNQTVDVVKMFIVEHPEKRHLVAAGLVAEALARAFPCRALRQ
jgi:hypothetical protein